MQRNDRIITDGFPDGFHVQDRRAENEALLVAAVDWAASPVGHVCVCLRPKLKTTDDWLPIARAIASSLVACGHFKPASHRNGR
jgi:hypothetical protein